MLPHTFFLETVMACNLRCPECAIGGGITERRNSIMNMSDFSLISNKIKPYAKYVLLHMWGEPLLNKYIFEMIHEVASYARVNISTNALLLNEEKALELLRSGVSDLIVSIDGVSQEVYSKYRVGGSVAQALNNLKLLSRLNSKYSLKVDIQPQMIVFDHNYHEITAFESICMELGLVPFFKDPYIRNKNSEFRASSDIKFQRKTYENNEELIRAISGCNDPRYVFTISVNGDVVLCCHDYDSEIRFGNILDSRSTVENIWNSDYCQAIRKGIIGGKPCSFCLTKCMSYVLSEDYPVGA